MWNSRGRSNRLGAVEVLRPNLHRRLWVQLLLALWRWSIELTLLALVLVAVVRLEAQMPRWAALLVVAFPLVAALATPGLNRLVTGWAWVLVVRHRLRTAFVELGAHNRSGKLPWLIWWHPTRVGERVWLLMVAGLSVDDLANATEALASACWCRDVRVDKHRKGSMLLRVDVVRRDPLDTLAPIGSRLMAAIGRLVDPPARVTVPDHLPAWLTEPTPPPAPPQRPAPPATSPPPTSPPAPGGPRVIRNGEDLTDYVD